jgi:hypothetical protein
VALLMRRANYPFHFPHEIIGDVKSKPPALTNQGIGTFVAVSTTCRRSSASFHRFTTRFVVHDENPNLTTFGCSYSANVMAGAYAESEL